MDTINCPLRLVAGLGFLLSRCGNSSADKSQLAKAPELTANLTEAYSKVKAAEAVYRASKGTFLRVLGTSRTWGLFHPSSGRIPYQSHFRQLSVVAANAHYKSVQQLVSYLKITAPFAGVITDRRLSPGAFVGPGGQNGVPILKIKQLDRLRCE